MSDAVLAASLIREVAGPRGHDEPKKVLWYRAYQTLHKLNPRWTQRRVRALAGQEAARIEHREIKEMERAIAARRAIQEARNEHNRYLAETERLATFLATQDEAFHSETIADLRSIAGDLDSTGDKGD